MSDKPNSEEVSNQSDKKWGLPEILLIAVTALMILAVVLYNFINATKNVAPVIVYTADSSQIPTESLAAGNVTSVPVSESSQESEPSKLQNETNLAAHESSAASSSSEPASSSASEAIGIININTASAEELDKLPGTGTVKAAAIIDYRTEYGAFESISEIVNVSGIGEKTFEKIQNYITVE